MDEKKLQAMREQMRSMLDTLQKAPPLEKARAFLTKFCSVTQGLDEIQEQVRHLLKFNAIPVRGGMHGLRAVLNDPSTSPQTLVDLVKQDANQQSVPATPEAARAFLSKLADMLRQELGDPEEYQPLVAQFFPNYVVTLPNAEGRIEELRCIDTVTIDGQDYALLEPEHADPSGGPYTVYRFWEENPLKPTYELETDNAMIEKVIKTVWEEAGKSGP